MTKQKKVSPKKAEWIQGQIDEIRAIAHLPLTADGEIIASMDELTPRQKAYLSGLIQTKLLNTFWAGQAKFWVEDLEAPEPFSPFPHRIE